MSIPATRSALYQKALFASAMGLLFVFALSIPTVSTLAMVALFLLAIVRGSGISSVVFLKPLIILSCFAASYYGMLYYYGDWNLRYCLQWVSLVVVSYWAGLAMGRSKLPNWPDSLVWLIFSFIAGFVLFSYLAVYQELAFGSSYGIARRTGHNVWMEGMELTATNIGLFISTSMCQLPVLIFGFGWRSRTMGRLLLAAALSICIAVGFYVNTMLLNRSPLIAMSLAFSVSWLVYFMFIARGVKRMVKSVVVSGALLGVVFYFLLYYATDLSQYLLYNRIEESGLRSDRFNTWLTMLANIDQSLVGGRAVRLGFANYAHNLWLDVLWVAGIVPMTLLLIFHLMHVKDMLAVVRSGISPVVIICMLCLSVSFFVGFMVEPALQASVIYFALSCFFLGMLRRTAFEVNDAKSTEPDGGAA